MLADRGVAHNRVGREGGPGLDRGEAAADFGARAGLVEQQDRAARSTLAGPARGDPSGGLGGAVPVHWGAHRDAPARGWSGTT